MLVGLFAFSIRALLKVHELDVEFHVKQTVITYFHDPGTGFRTAMRILNRNSYTGVNCHAAVRFLLI